MRSTVALVTAQCPPPAAAALSIDDDDDHHPKWETSAREGKENSALEAEAVVVAVLLEVKKEGSTQLSEITGTFD